MGLLGLSGVLERELGEGVCSGLLAGASAASQSQTAGKDVS